jgi:hypothetical protein
MTTQSPLSRAIRALELGLKLKLGAYPAHGTGFVLILAEGNLDEFQGAAREALSALRSPPGEDGLREKIAGIIRNATGCRFGAEYVAATDIVPLISERERGLVECLETIRCDCARCCLVEQWELPGAGGRCAYYRARQALAKHKGDWS